MQRCVNVIGVGMSHFRRAAIGPSPTALVYDSARQALSDAGLSARDIGTVYAASGLMDGGALQHALKRAALLHVPLCDFPVGGEDSNVMLFRACQAIRQGQAECLLALGIQGAPVPLPDLTIRLGCLGTAAREYMARYRVRRETFAMVAVKARQHAALNPLVAFDRPLTLDEVLEASVIAGPLTYPQFAWPSAGVAAVLLCSDEFARRRVSGPRVRIVAQARVSPSQVTGLDQSSTFACVDYEVNVAAAREIYELAGLGSQEIGVCELHDSSTLNELLLYEALGLCPEGCAEKMVEDGDNTYGGNLVVNPSGGLLSLGQAPAVSGLAQCIELAHHLRGSAGQRQVADARFALQHQTGADGTVVTTLYQRE